jgi:3-methyl-2-oxobutanoate hydroxymethyltransferase
VDALLVGDSLGMVVLGYDSTVPVTMEEMLHHAGAVGRSTERALVIGDMPFGSYQVSVEQAIANGTRFLKEASCDCVKLEGGEEVCDAVRGLVRAGVPVMGHIGLTPQTAGQLGGFKVQGKDSDAAHKLLAEIITGTLVVPTVGIGAGAGCDGQVLVTNDMLGLFEKFTPKFVKQYCNLAPDIKQGVQTFIREIQNGSFPAEDHSFAAKEDFSDLLASEKK